MTLQTIALAVAGGFVPAFVWLFFWLKEDECPQPRHHLYIAFVAGMLAIPLALILEWSWGLGIAKLFNKEALTPNSAGTTFYGLSILIGFAFIEEFAKFYLIKTLIFWRKDFTVPADAMIYLITGALGFASVENVLYLVEPFGIGLVDGFEVSNLRFLGATLLHTLSSALLGFFIASAFFRSKFRKEVAIVIGLFFATILHALFNLLILVTDGVTIEPALILLAAVGIFILYAFERVKHKIKKYYA